MSPSGPREQPLGLRIAPLRGDGHCLCSGRGGKRWAGVDRSSRGFCDLTGPLLAALFSLFPDGTTQVTIAIGIECD